MKQFAVRVDVTMSGVFYVEAETEEDAENMAADMVITASDLRHFCHVGTEVLDVEESED